MTAARFFIEGRVQGVFFRASTRQQAEALGLRGYARNLQDGRVEVLAVGDVQAIERLEHWLKQGPPAAHVERIERIAADDGEAGPDFETA
ncbi:acylphosphatase [Noviluteimonas gilva]|uniref:Acylphosphatase n=1 Tax=Noviluteimonas gilva TaxID=2682097 RepID=A0A7C9HLQ9_9GAMM|nr:acylphosphatase [Lysobacter gilvus]MUV13915.1 acylphosphatase [Lysobacter gilvus]